MNEKKLKKILHRHAAWRVNKSYGVRADLRGAYLRGAYLRGVCLRDVWLRDVWLRGANLSYSYLRESDLRESDLRESDLRESDLRGVCLRGVDLRGSDLRGANLDFSAWPLECGSVGVTIDDKLAKQLVYHAICNLDKKQMQEFLNDPVAYANDFHRVISGDVKEIKK